MAFQSIFSGDDVSSLMSALKEVQDKQVLIDKDAKSYTNKYTKLDYAIKVAQPLLSLHGLVVTQDYGNIDGSPAIVTTVCHVPTGQYKCSALPFDRAGMAKVSDAQDYFAGSSYARRYAYLGAIGWASSDDTDGNFGDKKPAAKKSTGKKAAAEKRESSMPLDAMQEITAANDMKSLIKSCGDWKDRAAKDGWKEDLNDLYRTQENKIARSEG